MRTEHGAIKDLRIIAKKCCTLATLKSKQRLQARSDVEVLGLVASRTFPNMPAETAET